MLLESTFTEWASGTSKWTVNELNDEVHERPEAIVGPPRVHKGSALTRISKKKKQKKKEEQEEKEEVE